MARRTASEYKKQGRAELVRKVIQTLQNAYGKCTIKGLAGMLGLEKKKIENWKLNGAIQEGNVEDLVNAIIKHAIRNSYNPVVEIEPINAQKKNTKYEIVFERKIKWLDKIKEKGSCGIYIFYDSRGKAVYAGRSVNESKQSLWAEMNDAFNRERFPQEIVCSEKGKLKRVPYFLYEAALYVSVYLVHEFAIKDFEALLIRSFPNDLTNIRMETKSKSLTTKK